jgi:serine/threonine-protein kinase
MATPLRSDIFGDVAVEIGFVAPAQVMAALDRQRQLAAAGTQKLIGEILVEFGAMTAEQVENVLRVQKDRRAARARTVGPYKIIEKIGAGGMGAVYRARETRTGKQVALKILPPRLASDARYLMRFFREAQMAGRLDHENIVKGLGIGEAKGVHYFAMEFVDGENIQEMLTRVERFPEDTALKIIVSAARALQHAHEHRLVHQDIKPENLIMDRKGVVKLLDLGLARRATDLTKSRLGTPLYVSPEHVKGDRPLDIRSDIYSLGVTLYHMVTGSPPFVGTDEQDTMARHVEDEVPWPQDVVAELSEGICQVISRMLAKDPGDRYREPKYVTCDIELVLDGVPPRYALRASKKSPVRPPDRPTASAKRRARAHARVPPAVSKHDRSLDEASSAERRRRRASSRRLRQVTPVEAGAQPLSATFVYLMLGAAAGLLAVAAYLVLTV